MRRFFRSLRKREDGMGTVEVVIIVAVLVGVALLFKAQITGFVQEIGDRIFRPDAVVQPLVPDTSGQSEEENTTGPK
ncbi:MAG: Flp1 family type IVb pilin [Peptococcia bacterium]